MSHFADFAQVKIMSHFTDFGQVKIFNKTPLGEAGFLSSPYFLNTGSLGIQFFDSPPIPTQSVRLPFVTYPSLCSTGVTYRMLCHSIGHQVLLTQPLPREREDFPRGGNHSEHVLLLTYLA